MYVFLFQMTKQDLIIRLMNDPFPAESQLSALIDDVLDTQIVSQTMTNLRNAIDFMTWTFLYRLLTMNPIFYGIVGTTNEHLSDYLSDLVETTVESLA